MWLRKTATPGGILLKGGRLAGVASAGIVRDVRTLVAAKDEGFARWIAQLEEIIACCEPGDSARQAA